MTKRVLVTGGAGYIGSHVVDALIAQGFQVVILDNLSLGHAASVPADVPLIMGDVTDPAVLDAVLADGPWHAVLHFAGLSQVGDSMLHPLRYLRENGAGGMVLIEACLRHGISRFVLSSTANLFGAPVGGAIDEDAPIAPGSPYGESKLIIERALHWASARHDFRYATLRFFNAAGADPKGRLGEDHDPESHLIPLAIDAALGRRPALTIFGADYPTPDGTCIRDYLHVSDLCDAHVRALARLEQGSVTYNIGSGTGHSVLEVVTMVERVSGLKVPVIFGARRGGDPAVLVAASGKIRRETGWTPRYPGLEDIVRTAYAWRLRHDGGYPKHA
jgi:UDP-glucose 4-epimerase